MTDSPFQRWVDAHREDYDAVSYRVQRTRDVFLDGTDAVGESLLEMAYTFAVLSIQTGVDRAETGFTAYYAGDASLTEATAHTAFHNQKAGWLSRSYIETDWSALLGDLRVAVVDADLHAVLDRLTDLTGLGYRKAGFTAALCGIHELMCIDRHVADFAGLGGGTENSTDRRSFTDAEDYLATCEDILQSVGRPMQRPFLVQWAIFDFQRGEHVTHLPFYRRVLPQQHLDP